MHFVRELVRNKCAVKLEYCASLARVLASDQSGPGNRRMSVRRLLRPGLRGRAACGSDPLGADPPPRPSPTWVRGKVNEHSDCFKPGSQAVRRHDAIGRPSRAQAGGGRAGRVVRHLRRQAGRRRGAGRGLDVLQHRVRSHRARPNAAWAVLRVGLRQIEPGEHD